MSGMAISTSPESLRLVTDIITIAPMSITRLRSTIEADVEKADLMRVVSAVSRETTSPVRSRS